MRTRYFVSGILAAALLSSTALAQTSTTPRAPAATATEASTLTGHWRASKLIGVNVYNEANEKLGGISEVILDPSGKVTGYVVGVGGFLGMGEHDILVEPGKIKFVNEPVRTSANTPAANPPATNPPAAGAPTNTRNVSSTRASSEKWYPDHGVMSATKEQLKAMQAFKY
jgi:sporulation protein YlmC with PRC-barrel domain